MPAPGMRSAAPGRSTCPSLRRRCSAAASFHGHTEHRDTRFCRSMTNRTRLSCLMSLGPLTGLLRLVTLPLAPGHQAATGQDNPRQARFQVLSNRFREYEALRKSEPGVARSLGAFSLWPSRQGKGASTFCNTHRTPGKTSPIASRTYRSAGFCVRTHLCTNAAMYMQVWAARRCRAAHSV